MAQVQTGTRAAIAKLLDAPFEAQCSWADEIKGERPETRTWHYLNAPPDSFEISSIPRPKEGDIISALTEQTYRLKHESAGQRREALLWVGHLVGDLHQPLHLGYASDLGGNRYRLDLPHALGVQLQEKRATVSLHAVWDGLILRYQNQESGRTAYKDAEGYRDAKAIPIEQPEEAILAWADETLSVLNEPNVHYRHGARLQTLTSDYLISNQSAVEQQIRRAAARLAALLDWAFDAQN